MQRSVNSPVRGKASRPRVLIVAMHYPQLSQTYIKSELKALRGDYEIKVVATSVPNIKDPEHLPFERIENFEQMIEVVRSFRPTVIHGHYLVQARLLSALAALTDTPFTIRAHSFDAIVTETRRPKHLDSLTAVLDFEHCLGILALPFTRPFLESSGLPATLIVDAPPVVDFHHFYNRANNGTGIMNIGACLAKKRMEDFVELAARMPSLEFDLYPIGYDTATISALNAERGGRLNVHEPRPFSSMPAVYKKHDWLVYTACPELKTVGWPMAVAEAQASGVAVCMAHIRADLIDYVGDAGYLYESISEVEQIIDQAPPAPMREAGFDRARSWDIKTDIHLLTDLWASLM
jgi:glycosyltransferase involved in cell wall biosynthesis